MEPYEAPVSGTDGTALTVAHHGLSTAYRFTTPHTQWSGTYTPTTQTPIVSAAWLKDLNTFDFTAAHVAVLLSDRSWEPYVLTTPDSTWAGPAVQLATPTNDPDDAPR